MAACMDSVNTPGVQARARRQQDRFTTQARVHRVLGRGDQVFRLCRASSSSAVAPGSGGAELIGNAAPCSRRRHEGASGRELQKRASATRMTETVGHEHPVGIPIQIILYDKTGRELEAVPLFVWRAQAHPHSVGNNYRAAEMLASVAGDLAQAERFAIRAASPEFLSGNLAGLAAWACVFMASENWLHGHVEAAQQEANRLAETLTTRPTEAREALGFEVATFYEHLGRLKKAEALTRSEERC